MTPIRIDDLPVTEHLTPEEEALIAGAGLKFFRPSFEALGDRHLMSAHLGAALPLMSRPALGPAAFGQNALPDSPQGGPAAQLQLQAAINRRDFQLAGKIIFAAAHREAEALWGDKVAAGILQVAPGEVIQSEHKVLVKFRLNDVIGGTLRGYSGFEVEIQYDANGAVTAEGSFREAWGRSFFLPLGQSAPFVQNMNRALGAPPRGEPTLAEGFL